MRVLAIDYGEKRIGLALCDELEITTRSAGILRHRKRSRVVEEISRLVQREGVEQVVLGLPVRLDGSEGQAAGRVRKFAVELSKDLSVPVSFQDERLTSHAAREWLAAEGKSTQERGARVDEYAARIILQDFLASKPTRP